jgi:hypothetical protein
MQATHRDRPRTSRELAIPLALAVLLASACGTKQPVLYPNPHLQKVGSDAAQAEIAECTRLAREYVRASPAREAATDTAKGAVVGGATGAATGAVLGSVGRGAGAGAAGGATLGFMSWLFGPRDPDPLERGYVEHCLRERGYQTMGWR